MTLLVFDLMHGLLQADPLFFLWLPGIFAALT